MAANGMKAAGHEYIVVNDYWVGITMREALGRAGYPVVFSLCGWGTARPRRRLVKTTVCCASSTCRTACAGTRDPATETTPI